LFRWFKESRNYLLRDNFSRAVTVFQRPQRPRLPPLSGPLFPRPAPRLPPRWLSQAGPPPLYEEVFWLPAPRPRWDGAGGNWPDSQRGGGQGRGGGGGLLFAVSLFLAGAGTGTTDSCRSKQEKKTAIRNLSPSHCLILKKGSALNISVVRITY
jgi:hypothetical protein